MKNKNHIKKFCALLLVFSMVLGVFSLQGVGGAFAMERNNTGSSMEDITEPATEMVTEVTAEPATDSETETTGDPTTEPETEATADPTAEPISDLTDDPATDSATEPATDSTDPTDPTESPTEEPVYPNWADMTDADFVAWLMNADNAEIVKTILNSGSGEEYEALNSRIGEITDTTQAQQVKTYLVDLRKDEYIYFDLAAGDVNIGKTTYTGYVYVGGEKKTVSAITRTGNEKFYIYQSTAANRMNTGYATREDFNDKTGCRVPEYSRVKYGGELWTEFVKNNTDVRAVSEAWETAAKDADRTAIGEQKPWKEKSTGNHITFTGESKYEADVTIDNIWTYYQECGQSRLTGGITAHLVANTNTKITLRLKGDNRFGNIHYGANKNTQNQIIFKNGEDEGKTQGSITVADFPMDFMKNYWCSGIGGDDNKCDRSDGIVIESGVIYSGTTSGDDCTAIGGGGNEFGRVTIKGGTVTAVAASTGTAIGGGIGWGSQGGDADVTISGGTVYAYNQGIGPDSGNYVSFVPAAAIGGGSASTNNGNKSTTVTITGGTVYAQSMGGAAIGGGGSGTKLGGSATVNIKGGTVIAKSIGGTVQYEKDHNKNHTEKVSAGVSIGGGTGDTGGGSVTLNISEDTVETVLRTGSIGGGKTTGTGTIGNATVTITGGDVTGQVIMAGTGDENKKCSFTMKDGRLHSTNVIDGNTITDIDDPREDVKIEYLQKNGGAVWMDDPIGVTNISGGTIENCTAELGGAIYMKGGKFNLSGTGKISGNTAKRTETGTGMGGGVYVTGGDANINGGSVSSNTAQVRGGGVYVNGGAVNMSDGFISSNTASDGNPDTPEIGRGGGVYLTDGDFTMTGGTIKDNTAKYRGGGIFLTRKPTLSGGIISGNKAGNSGGGLCINGDALELKSTKMRIFGNTADENGGGVAVLNGSFTLSGGAVGVENEEPNYAKNGGGVYVQAENAGAVASATVNSGNIWYNKAVNGGGIYLAKGDGTFTLNGENAIISHNEAENGGGIYLYRNPNLLQGKIEQNTAMGSEQDTATGSEQNTDTGNGGGMYISDCLVTLAPEKEVIITDNKADKNGAGIYIHDSTKSSGGNSGEVTADGSVPPGSLDSGVDAISSASPTQRVGLLVENGFAGRLIFTNNTATDSGGAVCVDVGRFYLESDNVTVTGNQAKNGGGVAVLSGNFTMSAGSIGAKDGANTATESGGGVYVADGEVWLKGGSVGYNKANSGGAYVDGEFNMLGGTIGGNSTGNHAKNGGGVYVANGDITIVNGEILYNSASENGGGFFASATEGNVNVLMLSGKLNHNTADENGGGMAVESYNEKVITVEIGCLLDHHVTDEKPTLPIAYDGDYGYYATYNGKDYEHDSCPEVQYNQAGKIGGGFYMNSDSSSLHFYCVEETANSAQSTDSGGMDVLGGNVSIGDYHYHNYEYNSSNTDDDPRPNNVPWGYVSMDDATLVNGGQVNIYGDMTNPVFRDEVTVDIKNDDDRFLDHRRAHTDEKRYKVHYIENFQSTGLYQAYQYDESNKVITIKGTLYSHPGYKILGWYTKAEYNPAMPDPNHKFYEVGESFDLSDPTSVPQMGQHSIDCEQCGKDHEDSNLLELYAIWEANGYTVVFDPNVPQGGTYTGSMEKQIHQYGVKQKLTLNAYEYQGHIFDGWNTQADGKGTAYKDGDEVSNLTDKNGEEVVLYAQWIPCDHKDSHKWSYEVSEDGKTLLRICSCGGQTLTATLSAENTVYDGLSHSATLTLDDKDAWGDDAPTVKYEGYRLSTEDTAKYGDLKFEDEHGNHIDPYHAGNYRASITKKNGDIEVTAFVEYIIAKAEQDAPGKPTYKVPDGTSNVVIDKLNENTITDKKGNDHTAEAEYRLSYYADNVLQFTDWKKITDTSLTITITMENAWTSYNVEARYEELEDYKPSDVTRADAVYHYAGDVTVKIICDEGIEAYFDAELNDVDKTLDGAKLQLTTKTGYYLIGGDYDVKATLQKDNSTNPEEHPVEKVPGENKEYSVKNIPDNSILTIYIGKAKKSPQVKAQVMPGQKFSPFAGAATTISRDSAFTAAFQISNFDPNTYGVPQLIFESAIPAKTAIILLDRVAGTYWFYCAENEINTDSSVSLGDFKKMGGSDTETYSTPTPGTNGYVDLSYQFIVDFSQCAGGSNITSGYIGDSLKMTLEAPRTTSGNDAKAPEANADVTVTMKDSSFTFANTKTDGLTNSFKCTFEKDADASKWENRASALVLKPSGGTDLPADAQIKAEIVGGGTTYLYKSEDSFIIPLSLLEAGDKDVNLTLQSALFPVAGGSYTFTAEWLISPSETGKAPVTGDYINVTPLDVTFTSAAKVLPSLKTKNGSRILSSGETLKVDIETRNMDGYTISAELLRKSDDGKYEGIGWNKTNVSETDGVSVTLGGYSSGSYCLMFTVKETSGVTVVMEVPYYFVVRESQ